MVALGAVAAGTTLVNVAKSIYGPDLLPDVARSLGAGDLASDAYRAKSLTQRAKQCFIESRAYIDKDILHEKVTAGIVKFTLTITTSLVISTLGLDSMVESGVTVSDRLRAVATESYIDTALSLRQMSIGLESVDPKLKQKEKKAKTTEDIARVRRAQIYNKIKVYNEKVKENPKLAGQANHLVENLLLEKAKYDKIIEDAEKETERLRKVEFSDVTPTTDVNLPVGKVIEITLNGPRGAYKIPLFVRVNPYTVDPSLVSFLLETTGESMTSDKRRAMLKAGEITFWKDYVFGLDQVRRMQKVLSRDKDGEFAEFIARNSEKEDKRIRDTVNLIATKGYRTSSNLANAVLIFSEAAVRDGQMRGGTNLLDFSERQRFFDKNFASMMFVVDPAHEKVTLYLNGFSDVGHYSYSDFTRKKDLEGEDFMSVLRTISAGNVSRF